VPGRTGILIHSLASERSLLLTKAEPSHNKAYLPSRHSFLKTDARIPAHINGRNAIRGRRTTTIRDEAQRCAEKIGYHWLVNTDPALSFDGLMYHTGAVVAVMLKKVRYAICDDCIIEKKFPDEVNTLPGTSPSGVRAPRALDQDAERADVAPVLYPAGDDCRN